MQARPNTWRELPGWFAWSCAVGWLALLLPLGWIPHDDGALAQSAARVLAGEVPHHDFGELYTGLLTYAHALAFSIGGEDLLSLRVMLLVAFALWVPILYWLARRSLAPWKAAGMTMVAAVWSVPTYPASMPSWYLLFLATAAAALLLHGWETQRRIAIGYAGALAGIAVLVKITGLFIIAGLSLSILVLIRLGGSRPTAGNGRSGALAVTALTGILVALTAWLLRPPASPRHWVHLGLPVLMVCGAIVWTEWRRDQRTTAIWRDLLALAGPFAAGVSVACLGGGVGYIVAGGTLGELVQGAFLAPLRRITGAASPPPDLVLSLAGLLVIGAWTAAFPRRSVLRPWMMAAGVVLALAALASIGFRLDLARIQVAAVRMLLPLSAALGAVALTRRPLDQSCATIAVLVPLTALYGLSQYPFSNTTYFAYVAPLGILSLAALWPHLIPERTPAAGVLAVYLAGFAMYWLPPGLRFVREGGTLRGDAVALLPPRGNILVPPAEHWQFARLAELTARHAGNGPILALPDCPEVYFLTGLPNPTSALFDFLEEPSRHSTRIRELAADETVRVAVLNLFPDFSGPIPAEVSALLQRRFPHSERVGDYEVRWR